MYFVLLPSLTQLKKMSEEDKLNFFVIDQIAKTMLSQVIALNCTCILHLSMLFSLCIVFSRD